MINGQSNSMFQFLVYYEDLDDFRNEMAHLRANGIVSNDKGDDMPDDDDNEWFYQQLDEDGMRDDCEQKEVSGMFDHWWETK